MSDVTQLIGWTSQTCHDRYDRYMRDHDGELDMATLCESFYLTGYNDGVRSTVVFSDVVPLAWKIIHRLESVAAVLEDATR